MLCSICKVLKKVVRNVEVTDILQYSKVNFNYQKHTSIT